MPLSVWKPPKIWSGESCWIIGGGPSILKQFSIPENISNQVLEGKALPHIYSPYMAPIFNKHTIGINNAYQIGSWLDFCFFGDSSWYLIHRKGLSTWPGLKVTCSTSIRKRSQRERQTIKLVRKGSKKFGISSTPGEVYWNYNSGAASISLAVQLGVKRIFLLGFDMNLSEKKESHWHDRPGKKKIPDPVSREQKSQRNFKRHLQGFPAIASDAERMGVEILNVNPESSIEVFEKITLGDALNG